MPVHSTGSSESGQQGSSIQARTAPVPESVASESMDVDEDAAVLTEDEPIGLEDAKEILAGHGKHLQEKMNRKMQMYTRLHKPDYQPSAADRSILETVNRDADKAEEAVNFWNEIVAGLEKASKAVQSPCAPVPMPQGSAPGNSHMFKDFRSPDVKMSGDIPSFHRPVEPQLMPKVDPKTSGPIRTNVRLFLHEFQKIGLLKYGQEKFEAIGYRLLQLANLDEKVGDAFSAAKDAEPGVHWGWNKCEQKFVDAALTALEKAAEVDEFARAGREKGESYKQFFHRLRRLVEVYKVKELPKHADVTESLRMSIPSLALTVMQVAEVQKRIMQQIGMSMPDMTTLDFLMESIPNVHGPDDCDEWKPVIDAARRQRGAREGEDTRKQQQQQPRKSNSPTVAGTAVSNASTQGANTVSTHQHHPHQQLGYSRGRYQNRGGFHGGYRGGYRGGGHRMPPYASNNGRGGHQQGPPAST
ncbi:hypothetical protein BGZ82_002423 [Podila clonocystis]|nr:hypothetical protein BGZ82_002423 [Podila clonocystis]